jgi:primosomal protein N' (replication factor Y)
MKKAPTMHALVCVDKIYRDDPFCLTVPENLEIQLKTGCQVLVRLDHYKASAYTGYVLSIDTPPGEMETCGEVIDLFNNGERLLTDEMLKLVMWIADYYLSKPIDAITTAIPSPLRNIVDDIVERCEFRLESPDAKVRSSGLRRSILQVLSTEKRLSVRQLRKRLGRKELYATLYELERGGLIRLSKSFPDTPQKTVQAWRLSRQLPVDAEKMVQRSPKKREAYALLTSDPEHHFCAGEAGLSRDILNGLVALGLAEKTETTAPLQERLRFDEPQKHITSLGRHQQQVLDTLAAAAAEQQFRTFLLHGVTGSGKTLIYTELIRKILDQGKTAIVLVPEISLTPQTAARFRHYFDDQIQIMHSAMSDREKYEAWQRLRQGKARIALGARSTVFAPLENIGAIIVDEEHDAAYKQDRTPRYHARDTAVMRARFCNALCILGSATPSFESYNNSREGKYTLLELPERIDHARMPTIRLVWMPGSQQVTPSLSGALYDAIRNRILRNEQVILLQNRRGFAGSLLCLQCGHTPHCRFCNIPLVYHASDLTLRCHYCGHLQRFSNTCPSCSSDNIFYKNSGTERIEEELQALFPEEKILRMDVDTTSTKDAHASMLTTFREKQARILLGTQMVAKGLDFPDVTLVGVLMADIGLNLPDFRASERVYSLLMQVAGRAGRSSSPGEVLLQLYNKDNDLFSHVLQADYRSFFDAEMMSRRQLGYPPLSRLVRFECSAPSETVAEQSAERLRTLLAPQVPEKLGTILGPAPAGIVKIKGRYRYQLILKLYGIKLPSALIRQAQAELMSAFRGKNLVITTDIDPQYLL